MAAVEGHRHDGTIDSNNSNNNNNNNSRSEKQEQEESSSVSQSPSTGPKLHNSAIALASTSATVVAKSLLHPIDTLKCRLQSSSTRGLRGFSDEYRGKWGPRYLYGGLPIKLVFYIPYQAVYMTTYSNMKEFLRPADVSGESRVAFLTRTIAAASSAELASCIVRVPMETAKMRIQATVVPNTQSAVRQMYQHGILSCARLVKSQTLLHDIPYSAIQWMFYETLRPRMLRIVGKHELNSESEKHSGLRAHMQNFLSAFFSGGFSGMMASTITVPLDAIRTRVVVATAANPRATVRSVVRDTYKAGGISLFFRGACTRVFWVTMNMAVYFPLYEVFKSVLLARQEAASR
ncbi:Mitochondrial substrate/solute carrier [Trypanosoma melophagium]|uniref:Mitochondrial substrate/solute carrier n=1 Tax=Trypanosoma melophagium TaxID=715481 RepID=UPI00351A2BB3|nr:Mitochondrial substrate/solute carrier [Trypanosoma melophagium]